MVNCVQEQCIPLLNMRIMWSCPHGTPLGPIPTSGPEGVETPPPPPGAMMGVREGASSELGVLGLGGRTGVLTEVSRGMGLPGSRR